MIVIPSHPLITATKNSGVPRVASMSALRGGILALADADLHAELHIHPADVRQLGDQALSRIGVIQDADARIRRKLDALASTLRDTCGRHPAAPAAMDERNLSQSPAPFSDEPAATPPAAATAKKWRVLLAGAPDRTVEADRCFLSGEYLTFNRPAEGGPEIVAQFRTAHLRGYHLI